MRNNPISSFGNIFLGTDLGGAALEAIGSSMGRLSDATKTMVSVGIFANAAKNTKSIFKWK